ncbi:MAG: tRNA 2-thiouridine(34) synthase MnmA [Planctomycetota bacterium]|nr:MAG: tRNA 2-thiouridine(34) synthase MnmA [Planctomycetota bacterium]
MSGGVDSSVAASLLRDAGYECVGAFIRVGAHAAEAEATCEVAGGAAPRRLRQGCCSAVDAADARAVAGRLGIPFYALNFEGSFERIIDYFVDEYVHARTPNPCVMCNIDIKFGRLLRYADMLDAEFVATGHYARVLRDGDAPRLARSLNYEKDQSYVLFGIRRGDLSRCLFPLGQMRDKRDVRRIAAGLGLRVHDKPDSQEICFVPDNDYRSLVRRRRPQSQRPGDVVDSAGRVLGTHDGVAGFTIGQRRGLGIAAGKPLYVTKLDVVNNRVVVGERDELRSRSLVAENVNWLVDRIDRPTPANIKIRHTHQPAAGRLTPGSNDQTVVGEFDEPQLAVTPGQAAVFYAGDVVLCGGWIRSAESGGVKRGGDSVGAADAKTVES